MNDYTLFAKAELKARTLILHAVSETLVLELKDSRFIDNVEYQCACFDICLGKHLVVVQARFPHDIFLPDDGRFVVCQISFVRRPPVLCGYGKTGFLEELIYT